MRWWRKGTPVNVETTPRIRSFDINGEKYLHYGDVIQFMMDEGVTPEIRWSMDKTSFFQETSGKEGEGG